MENVKHTSMKKILGLDLGTNSTGWALVNEAENTAEKSSITKLGVRIIKYDNFVNTETGSESKEPEKDFCGGKGISPNAGRTKGRSARRNLQRYKLRRANLIEYLKKCGLITDSAVLCENGNRTTFQTYRLRAMAVTEEISLEELSRVFLMINKKRGYKSSRKAKLPDEGQLIDGMAVAEQLYENDLTPGQFVFSILQQGKKSIPEFYRSDLQNELNRIWDHQKQFYPEILTDEFRKQIEGEGRPNTAKMFLGKYKIYTADIKGKDKRLQAYQWRSNALTSQLSIDEVAFVVSELNGAINNASSYLGAIGDRSKELRFNKLTVGQYLMKQLDKDPNYSLKNQVFYRQDYLDEFEAIWEKQAQYHPELTPELKKDIRDIIIFYQRPLKSQKGLVSFCEFESRQIEVNVDGKQKLRTIGCKVCPKSSPLFQEFKIWHTLHSLIVKEKKTNAERFLYQEEKETLFAELNIKETLSKLDALKLLYKNYKDLDLNYDKIEGNRTQAALFKAYQTIISMTGHGEYDFSKMMSDEVMEIVEGVFSGLGYNTNILHFDAENELFDKYMGCMLWHLLYSYEGDKSSTGNKSLIDKIFKLCGFEKEYASIIANIIFQPDYGSLSTKAIRKILPRMKEGNEYSLACEYAGYRHSQRSLTKDELDNKVYKDHLDLLPRNSLRNPVVEKILNQMINVVNFVVDAYGKPDEIRIELARELKKSSKERKEMTMAINKTTADHEKYRQILQKEFGLTNVTRNDIIRYKLYLELKSNGYKTLYSNTYIPQEKLFSKEFDIEHIIPKAKLFDDSFSNKTLESRRVNIEKSNLTAYDYVLGVYDEKGINDYEIRIENLYKSGIISKAKRDKLMMKEVDIPSGFIERDLRDSQYIAKKAREILEELVKFVVPTTGTITDRLREDWQLIDVMQELNWEKYDKLGLTEIVKDKDGREIRRIKDWTKRNDHRHHAMDALTVAFTKRSYIQYLNNLNARSDKSGSIYAIEQKELYRDKHGKLRFNPPMPLDVFRAEAKRQLENTLISIKARNKVLTQNVNITKTKKTESGYRKKVQLTPRGQLHNETFYGAIKWYVPKLESVGSGFNVEQIALVANKRYREALLTRLAACGNDPKKAFTGKNSLEKNPLYLDELHTQQVPTKVKTVTLETVYTTRKDISSDLKIEKVIDRKVRSILKERLKEFGGDPKKAFSNLDANPIWLNKEKGISIKRVTITAVSKAEPLHAKRDHFGKYILDANGAKQPVDYVNTGNNHHVAIYRDEKGVLQERVVSFYEATASASVGLPVVDKEYRKSEGWTFLFSMKQNEYFVFPNEKNGFNPNEIDLMDPDNYALISPNLFRVQKITSKDYVFRHHLETTVEDRKELQNITWKRFQSLTNLDKLVKVRVNHIGQIVSVGEY